MDDEIQLFHGPENLDSTFYRSTSMEIAVKILGSCPVTAESPSDSDFASGFYLSPDYSEAVMWARRKSTAAYSGVILKYQIPQRTQNSWKIRRLDDPGEWSCCIKAFRLGAVDLAPMEEIFQYDVLWGAKCANVQGIASGEEPRPYSEQFCIVNRGILARLNRYLKGIQVVRR